MEQKKTQLKKISDGICSSEKVKKMNYAERINDIKDAASKMTKPVYQENKGSKDITPRTDLQQNKSKLFLEKKELIILKTICSKMNSSY